jgi:hypothetical protein
MWTILYVFLEDVWGFRTEHTHKEITTRFWNNDSEDAGGRRETYSLIDLDFGKWTEAHISPTHDDFGNKQKDDVDTRKKAEKDANNIYTLFHPPYRYRYRYQVDPDTAIPPNPVTSPIGLSSVSKSNLRCSICTKSFHHTRVSPLPTRTHVKAKQKRRPKYW